MALIARLYNWRSIQINRFSFEKKETLQGNEMYRQCVELFD